VNLAGRIAEDEGHGEAEKISKLLLLFFLSPPCLCASVVKSFLRDPTIAELLHEP
jgi:hypothetical protein